MATSFKKREVSADRVAAVESVSASIPIVGDPRMSPSEIGLADTRPCLSPQELVRAKIGLRSLQTTR